MRGYARVEKRREERGESDGATVEWRWNHEQRVVWRRCKCGIVFRAFWLLLWHFDSLKALIVCEILFYTHDICKDRCSAHKTRTSEDSSNEGQSQEAEAEAGAGSHRRQLQALDFFGVHKNDTHIVTKTLPMI
ncbi:hypothetical protein VNO80_18352 [Phaseolus coccineus]|uniref:Uncharacterized protein n=1 Tax=Phaseolus coccineus TaxID=3886 RepID=A0AAN9ME92_PHACN